MTGLALLIALHLLGPVLGLSIARHPDYVMTWRRAMRAAIAGAYFILLPAGCGVMVMFEPAETPRTFSENLVLAAGLLAYPATDGVLVALLVMSAWRLFSRHRRHPDPPAA